MKWHKRDVTQTWHLMKVRRCVIVHVMQLTRRHHHLVEAEVGRNLRRTHRRNRRIPELGVAVQTGSGIWVSWIPRKLNGGGNISENRNWKTNFKLKCSENKKEFKINFNNMLGKHILSWFQQKGYVKLILCSLPSRHVTLILRRFMEKRCFPKRYLSSRDQPLGISKAIL